MSITLIKLFVNLSITIVCIVMVDYIIPSLEVSEKVVRKVFYHQQTKHSSHMNYGLVTETTEIPTDANAVTYIKENEYITVIKTPILKTVLSIKHKGKCYDIYSVYNFYAILPVVSLLSGIWTRFSINRIDDKYLSPLALHLISTIFLILFFILNRYV